MAVSRKTPNKIPIAKQMKGCIIFRDSRHSFFFCVAHKCHHIKASPAWYALRVGGRETGRRLSGNRFFHSQIKHWASWQISTLMRLFERLCGFRWCYYTTNRAKRKAASPKVCRFNAFREKSHPIEIIVSHIQHFFNAFQPVADCRPAVMRLCCNVRQREPLNVPQ